MLSAPSIDKAPNQPTQLRVLAPNITMLLASLADDAPNQPPLTVQLKIPALLQQDLARVPGTLPAPVLQERLRRRDRGRPRHSREQREDHINGGHSVGGNELMD